MQVSDSIIKAAHRFCQRVHSIAPLGKGLIHDTYRVIPEDGPDFVLKSLHQQNVPFPENILLNYRQLLSGINPTPNSLLIPALLPTIDGHLYWQEESLEEETIRYWRATEFIPDSYCPETITDPQMAQVIASAYAGFAVMVNQLSLNNWRLVSPGLHDLSTGMDQLETAIQNARIERLLKATHVIASLRERSLYQKLYHQIISDPTSFPLRLMHHDAKISNILLDASTLRAKAIIDLDTLQPGLFFSDPGELLRTAACTENEESRHWEKIDIEPAIYTAFLQAYTDNSAGFTNQEKKLLPYSGILITYLQTIRFTTDYLNNDLYYQTADADHNLHRAFNQLILLEKMEAFQRIPPELK